MKNESSKKGTGLIAKVSVILISLLLTFLIIFYIAFWRVPDRTKEIKQVIAKTDKRDAELDSFPPEKNGWTDYEKAIQKLNTREIKSKIRGGVIEAPPENSFVTDQNILDIIGKTINRNKSAMNLVDNGFNRETSFIYPDPDPGPGGSAKPDFQYENLMRFLVYAGDFEMSRGNVILASKRYLQSLDLLKSHSRRHFFSPDMYSNVYSAVFFRLEQILKDNRDNKELFTFILEKMDRFAGNNEDFTRFYETFFLYLSNNRKDVTSYLRGEVQRSISIGQFQAAQNIIPANLLAEREYRILQDTVIYYFDNPALMSTGKKHYISLVGVNDELLGTLQGKYHEYTYIETKVQGLKLLSALQLYRSDKGKFPDNLSRLIPGYLKSVPRDPFNTTAELRYIKKGTGDVLFYSIGNDGKDDNGGIKMLQANDTGDVVFLLK